MDISNELQIIESAELGNEVRIAVATAAEKLSENRDADISQELSVIQNGRYGIDIRNAIYTALEKLANSQPEGGGGVAGATAFDFRNMRLPDHTTGTVIASAGASGGVAGATTIIEED